MSMNDHDVPTDTSMQVIFETLRLATVVNGLLRKTTKDVEMNGELWLEITLPLKHFLGKIIGQF